MSWKTQIKVKSVRRANIVAGHYCFGDVSTAEFVGSLPKVLYTAEGQWKATSIESENDIRELNELRQGNRHPEPEVTSGTLVNATL